MTHKILLEKAKELTGSPIFIALFGLVILDILSGYVKAIKNKSLDSKVSTNGWLRHILVLITVVFVGVYTRALGVAFISYGVGLGFVGSYGLSFLENLEAIGVPFNPAFTEFFRQMRDRKIDINNAKVTIEAPKINPIEKKENN